MGYEINYDKLYQKNMELWKKYGRRNGLYISTLELMKIMI